MEHQTKKEEYMAIIASVLGIVMIIAGLLTVGGLATSCSSSISTTQYQAEFEKAQPLSTFPPYAG